MSLSLARKPTLNDPLLTRVSLDHQTVLHPYGFPVRIHSNSAIPIQTADISWRTYQNKFDYMPLEVRLLISESNSPACTKRPTFRSQGHLVSIVIDEENFACLDLSKGFSFGWATTATARNTEYFRQCLLDVMIYPLLEVRYLITLHAACVMFAGKGILLAGDCGAGKSSLAYACSRRGWTYVSDDASAFPRHASSPRVIGHPQKFRFREPVGELFPEFRGLKSTDRAYGKPTIEVATRSLKGIQTADESEVNAIIFLNRHAYQSGPPTLSPVTREAAWERLSYSVWAVQLPAFEERLTAVERLLRVPMYEMRYGQLDPAIDVLQRLAEDILV